MGRAVEGEAARHDKLVALGYCGSQRTTRRAVAMAKRDYLLGRVRVHRPWVSEPGMWGSSYLRWVWLSPPPMSSMRSR